jgi:hypothetical protein
MFFFLIPEFRKQHHIYLVISPLKSIIIDQISKATQFGIEAAGLMAREEMDDNTVKGFKKYINIFEETKHTHSSTHTWRPIVRKPSIEVANFAKFCIGKIRSSVVRHILKKPTKRTIRSYGPTAIFIHD